jgi:hypothetical protein
MTSQSSMPPSLRHGPCASTSAQATTTNVNPTVCATKEQTGSYQCPSAPSVASCVPGERCPGPEASNSSSGLEGMSALWPGCREFLGKTNLGSCCRGLFNFEPNTVFLNHNAYGTAAKPGKHHPSSIIRYNNIYLSIYFSCHISSSSSSTSTFCKSIRNESRSFYAS